MSKFLASLTITEALLLIIYLSGQSQSATGASKEQQQQTQQSNKDNRNQPLSNLDKVLKQTNNMKLDTIVDDKTVSNVTLALNEMAMNLRKMLGENKRLSSQVQEVLQRVQNVTGVNANSTIKNLQQQMNNNTNNSSLGFLNLSTLMPRFNL